MYNEVEIDRGRIDLFKKWRADWCLFATDVLKVVLDDDQKAILRAIQTGKLVAIVSGTARGKDFVVAVAAMCFMYLTPLFNEEGDMIENTKVALTAPTGRQVENVMYPEIKRLFERAKILPGRLVSTDIRTDIGEWFLTGFKADDTNKEAWSGFHAVNTMFIATEATGLSEITCAAIEGNLQGNSRFVLAFNPNTSIGYAARAAKSKRWVVFRLDDLNAPNVIAKKIIIPGQVDYEWVKDKVEIWCEIIRKEEMDDGRGDFKWEGQYYKPMEGALGDLFRIKVRGLFPKISEDILIPSYWIELANDRWRMVKSLGLHKSVPRRFGIDVAGMGRDSTVICERHGDFVASFNRHQSSGQADHMRAVGFVKQKLKPRDKVFIDTIGEGAGLYSRFMEMNMRHRVYSCKSSESAKRLSDVTGIYEFVNMRAYLAWAVRDWLNPANETGACLPPDSNLAMECSEIRYKILSSGKIQLEAKDDIKKRLKTSTDDFDSLSVTFYPHADKNRMSAHKLAGHLP